MMLSHIRYAQVMRTVLLSVMTLVVAFALQNFVYAQYTVLIGDRDQERGVMAFDPATNNYGVFGACPPAGTRYYYGVDVHPQDQTVWVCDVLARQIVVLGANGNCITQISTANYGIPVGISIHPTGRYAHITFQSNIIACYDIANSQWGPTTTVSSASGLYGLQWSPGGQALYVCDFFGLQLIGFWDAGGGSLTEMGRIETELNPYDVAVIYREGGRAPVDEIYFTETTGYYGPQSRISSASHAYDTPGTIFGPDPWLDHPQQGNGSVSFFGIEYSPFDNTLWVNDYARGELYQVSNLSTPVAALRYDESSKYGLGVALLREACVSHRGDVDNNGCVDDADLLGVLFAFGSTGSNLGRVDVNCDGVVDDADLLIVLFNFGAGC